MTTLESYWQALPRTDELDGFDETQSRAFLDLLICMALADDEVTAVERLGFAQAVLSLPPFEVDDWRVFESMEGVELVGSVKDRLDSEGDDYLDELVAAFETAAEREFVFTAVLRFTTPDGWVEREHEFATRLGTRFGFDDSTRDQIIANALLRMEDTMPEFDLDEVWSSVTHTSFLDSLNAQQSGALLRLLMVATFADGEVTDEERAALGRAITDMPAFAGAIDFSGDRGSAVLDNIRERYDEDRGALLQEISQGLGDETARRHAFRTAVEVLQADGFATVEADFVREVGDVFGLEQDVIDFVIEQVQ